MTILFLSRDGLKMSSASPLRATPILVYRILHVALCGCETWSLTWREEHGLRVFYNSVQREIFVPKMVDVKRVVEETTLRGML